MPTLGENRCARWIARRRKGLRPHGKSQRKYCRRLGTSSCRRAFDTPSKRRQLPGNLVVPTLTHIRDAAAEAGRLWPGRIWKTALGSGLLLGLALSILAMA